MDLNLTAPGAGSAGQFQGGNPYGQPRRPSTAVTAQFMESLRLECKAILDAAGIEADPAQTAQLLAAIQLVAGSGLGERFAASVTQAFASVGPLPAAGSRTCIPLFDLSNLWICGTSRERPFQGTANGGSGGLPRAPRVNGAFSSGATSINLSSLRGNVLPAVGQTFTIAGGATVYTVTASGTHSYLDQTATGVGISPALAVNVADQATTSWRILVNNGPGYSSGATVIAVDGLIDEAPCTGCTVVFANHATVYTVSLRTQRSSTGGCNITLTPALTASVPDNTLMTFTAAVSDNTDEGNEVETGVKPGQAWPYITMDGQMAHLNAATGGSNGAYPFVGVNSEINCNQKGFFTGRRTFAGTPLLELSLFGNWSVGEADTFLEAIIAPNWQASQGVFDFSEWPTAFQFDQVGVTGARDFRLDIRIHGGGRTRTGGDYTISFDANLVLGASSSTPGGPGCGAPTLQSRRMFSRVIDESILNWRRTDVQWPLLLKFEKEALRGLPGRMGAACQAVHNGTTNLLRVSHYSGRLWLGQH